MSDGCAAASQQATSGAWKTFWLNHMGGFYGLGGVWQWGSRGILDALRFVEFQTMHPAGVVRTQEGPWAKTYSAADICIASARTS